MWPLLASFVWHGDARSAELLSSWNERKPRKDLTASKTAMGVRTYAPAYTGLTKQARPS